MADRYDEQRLLAYLEGELDEAARAQLEQELARDEPLRKLLAQLADDRRHLRAMPAEQPPPQLIDDAIQQLERQMLLGSAADEPLPEDAPHRRFRLNRIVAYTGLAAIVAISTTLIVVTLIDPDPHGRANQIAEMRQQDAAERERRVADAEEAAAPDPEPADEPRLTLAERADPTASDDAGEPLDVIDTGPLALGSRDAAVQRSLPNADEITASPPRLTLSPSATDPAPTDVTPPSPHPSPQPLAQHDAQPPTVEDQPLDSAAEPAQPLARTNVGLDIDTPRRSRARIAPDQPADDAAARSFEPAWPRLTFSPDAALPDPAMPPPRPAAATDPAAADPLPEDAIKLNVHAPDPRHTHRLVLAWIIEHDVQLLPARHGSATQRERFADDPSRGGASGSGRDQHMLFERRRETDAGRERPTQLEIKLTPHQLRELIAHLNQQRDHEATLDQRAASMLADAHKGDTSAGVREPAEEPTRPAGGLEPAPMSLFDAPEPDQRIEPAPDAAPEPDPQPFTTPGELPPSSPLTGWDWPQLFPSEPWMEARQADEQQPDQIHAVILLHPSAAPGR